MALKIRLRRMGRKNAPTYRIVVAESSMPRDGRIVESLGHYNPRTEPVTLKVDRSRALHWIDNGAVPTETAKALLKRAGIFKPESAVAEAVETVVEGTKRVAKKAAGAAKSATTKAAAAVQAAAGEVRERAADVVEDVREAAADVVEDVREAAAEVAEEVRERVASVRGSDEGEGAAAAAESEGAATEEASPA